MFVSFRLLSALCVCSEQTNFKTRNVYKVLFWKPWKEYTALKNTCEDNVKEHIMEVQWEFEDWIHVGQNGGEQ